MKVLRNMAIQNKGSLPPGKLKERIRITQSGKIKDVFVHAYRRTSVALLISFWLCVFGYYGWTLSFLFHFSFVLFKMVLFYFIQAILTYCFDFFFMFILCAVFLSLFFLASNNNFFYCCFVL